jgi:hypothetical protein
MATVRTFGGRSYSGGKRSRREVLQQLELLATLLDSAILIPGTKNPLRRRRRDRPRPRHWRRHHTALSAWIVYEAHRLGVPRYVLVRMIGNVAIDGLVGAVPLVGETCGCCASTSSARSSSGPAYAG